MGLLDSLKKAAVSGGFMEETASHPVPVTSAPTTPSTAPSYKPISPLTPSLSGVVDQEDMNALQTSLASAATKKGYAEYLTMVGAMQGIPEPMRFTAALQAIQAAHAITPKMVLESLHERLALLAMEEQASNDQLRQHLSSVTDQLTAQAKSLTDKIAAHRAEIVKMESEHARVSTELSAKQAQVDAARLDFTATVNAIRSELTAHQTTITPFTV
jgi:hypothetical protein